MSQDIDFPTPQEMNEWLQRETADIKRAAELRIKDATALVNAYAAGDLTGEQANERIHRYGKRWGDILPGVLRSEGLGDDEILARIDQTREKQLETRRRS